MENEKSMPQNEIEKARRDIDESYRPLIFFHDDPDGLASFLLLYRYIGDGHGVPIKTTPVITTDFLRFVDKHEPDKVIIVDIAVVEQDFIDKAKVPVVWIDHHQLLERRKVRYYNPRRYKEDANIPASQVCYDIVEQDDWIAMIGCVGDWVLPPLAEKFSKEHPDLLPPGIKRPEDALFTTKIGFLTNMFSFLLKGKTKDVKSSIELLKKIKSAEELLEGKSREAALLKKRFEPVYERYQALLKEALDEKPQDGLVVHLYSDDKWSFTKEVSNEMFYRNPDKMIVIGRERNGSVKLSLRWAGNIPEILEEAISGLEARGGGHEHACGVVVSKDDYPEFIRRLRELVNSKQ
ncbi:hypothetical protein D6764_01835 [Candidatus Woesearchaeota archaeon]|nr:MAG: hypothetical protein D6764_01835 [Candidatus Woesearchaeota archaeon]